MPLSDVRTKTESISVNESAIRQRVTLWWISKCMKVRITCNGDWAERAELVLG